MNLHYLIHSHLITRQAGYQYCTHFTFEKSKTYISRNQHEITQLTKQVLSWDLNSETLYFSGPC